MEIYHAFLNADLGDAVFKTYILDILSLTFGIWKSSSKSKKSTLHPIIHHLFRDGEISLKTLRVFPGMNYEITTSMMIAIREDGTFLLFTYDILDECKTLQDLSVFLQDVVIKQIKYGVHM
jgi:hypothetical protein